MTSKYLEDKHIDAHYIHLSGSESSRRCLGCPNNEKLRLPFPDHQQSPGLPFMPRCLESSSSRPWSLRDSTGKGRERRRRIIESVLIHHSTPNEKIKQLIILTA